MSLNEGVVAERLLQVKAVSFSPEVPYTWASGWKSPVYCDNRKILSYPYARDFIKSELSSVIFNQFGEAESVAGVATAGISWGAMAADQLKLPFMYVRPKPKEHGLGNQIEGDLIPGQKVVVVEDLISTGKSSLQVCDVLRSAGAEVIGMVAIFTYGFDLAHDAFAKAGIPLFCLTNYPVLIAEAMKKGLVNDTQLNSLLNWRADPGAWNGIE